MIPDWGYSCASPRNASAYQVAGDDRTLAQSSGLSHEGGAFPNGFDFRFGYSRPLRARHSVSAVLRTSEVSRRATVLENIALILISLLLLGYLLFALLKPEKF